MTLIQLNNNKNHRCYWSLLATFAVLLLLPCNVFAQDGRSLARTEQIARAAQDSFQELQPRVRGLQENVAGLERSANNVQSEINRFCGNLSEVGCALELDRQRRRGSAAERTRARRQREQLKNLQRTRDNIKSNLDRVKKDYESAQAGLDGLSRVSARSRQELSPEVLQAQFASLDVKSDLLELTGDIQDVDRVLDNVAEVYDKSVLGAYLQDKITQMLTGTQPDLICQASNRCRGSGKGPTAVQVRNALFLNNNLLRRERDSSRETINVKGSSSSSNKEDIGI